jgi:glutamate-1-semialdehyde aminotransferase
MSGFNPLSLQRSIDTFEEGKALIPGGVLGIRRPYNFVEGEYPIFVDSGKGGHITDVDGNEYIDFLAAYGPIILGYREEEIDEAVIAQIRDKGFCFSLTQPYQNRLAETLRRLVPSAEMSLFVKTGSDATTLSIRLARAHTKRTKVIRCGYHGWHDWCVEVKGGIPKKLYEDVYDVRYNAPDELEDLLKRHGDDTAAVIITPFGHPLARKMEAPAEGYLETVRALCDKHGAVLVFDEIRTGFRVSLGGAQAYYNVTPDLSCLGKAMANGYAISAVCGRASIMKRAEKEVFVSSTFFPNSLGYVAALKTIEILERDDVLTDIWKKGDALMKGIQKAIDQNDVGAELSGIPPMSFITFKKDDEKRYKKRRTAFYTNLIRQHIFMQPYHHGYICHRHTNEDIEKTIKAIKRALQETRDVH